MPSPPVTEVLLVRHAQSVWNADRRWQGWADPPLSPSGEEQATTAGLRVAGDGGGTGRPFDVVVSSDLQRARRTAELVAGAAGIPGPVDVRPDLREHDVGEWSGLRHDEIEQRWPGLLAQWRSGALQATPGGEDRSVFEARILAGLQALAGAHAGRRVLTVAHGGVVTAASRLAAHELRHIDHLAGAWVELTGRRPVLRESVNLLGGPLPVPSGAA